jgi:ergothioneine biosynthesis protein EgtB
MQTPATGLDRQALVAWYRKTRSRTTALFDLLAPEAYYARPIPLRHPIVFYEGHLPAFSLNTLVKRALGRSGVDERLERLFARGIDPEERGHGERSSIAWPERPDVLAFVRAADALVLDALEHADLDRPGHPLLDRSEAVFAILEHEAMHQETLLYMWRQLPHELKRRPADYQIAINERQRACDRVDVTAGPAVLGAERNGMPFGWDNEFSSITVEVPAFSIDRYNVTNRDFLAFVEAGGYNSPRWWAPDDWTWLREEKISHPLCWQPNGDEWYWRGMFDWIPLPLSWPVYVSHAEASAYARWRGGRLPTEPEWHRAACATATGERRQYPWGDDIPDTLRGVFDFTSWEPHPVGSHPAGRSAWEIDDLVGNGWEWTSTVFAPFPGFAPLASYPEYSADFFDGRHFVLKGGGPATARELIRPSFRNWFRSRYPYVDATFRCVRP